MSKKTAHNTNSINPRTLDKATKKRIRSLLRRGDMVKIAKRCNLTSAQISNVIRGISVNDDVWRETMQYIDNLPKIEVDDRLAEYITEGETEAA